MLKLIKNLFSMIWAYTNLTQTLKISQSEPQNTDVKEPFHQVSNIAAALIIKDP